MNNLRFKQAQLAFSCALALGLAAPALADAQVSGRIIDSRQQLLAGAEVSIPQLQLKRATAADGRFLLVFSYSLDVLDEVVSYPDNIRLMSWLESFPAPLGMVLLTFGLLGWHREQLAINRQLQVRELFLRDHQLLDPLTQLYGPLYLQAVLDRELELHRQQQQPLSLLMLDISGFSDYNRRFGIAAGDHLLTQFSELLTHQLRQRDLICRYAGDCFVALLPQTEAATAQVLNRHLQQQLQQWLPEHSIVLTGVVLEFSQQQHPAVQNAEAALQLASTTLASSKQQCAMLQVVTV